MVREREIVGIYLDESNLDVFCLKGRMDKWSSAQFPYTVNDSGRTLAEQVKGVLRVIRPMRRRTICLALPRDAVFFRELSFPQLEPAEAANAVRMGVGLHAHLEPDSMYYDQWAFKRGDETIVLLAYCPRSFLDPVFRVVQETGHGKSLGPISPATIGMDILLRSSAETSLPCVCLGRQDGNWVVSLHGVHGWEGSHSVGVSDGEDMSASLKNLVQYLPPPFSRLVTAPAYVVGDAAGITLNPSPQDPCSTIKEFSKICPSDGRVTWGLCAASLGLSSYPAISLQKGPRRQPFRLHIKPFQFVAGATAAAIILATGIQGIKLQKRIHSAHQMEQEVEMLQKRLLPLQDTQKQLEQIESQLNDVKDFKAERPSELKIFKTVAELMSSETWIKSLNLKENKLRITAEGGSAVETMGKWRQSPLFSEVRLVSPVTKDRQQRERFSVEIILAGDKGKDSRGK